EPMKITVSESTYQLIKDDFQLTERGEFEVKGFGTERLYFLERELPHVRESPFYPAGSHAPGSPLAPLLPMTLTCERIRRGGSWPPPTPQAPLTNGWCQIGDALWRPAGERGRLCRRAETSSAPTISGDRACRARGCGWLGCDERSGAVQHVLHRNQRRVDVLRRHVEVADGADDTWQQRAHQDTALSKAINELGVAEASPGDAEKHHVGLRDGRQHLDAGDLGQPGGELPGIGVVFGQTLDMVLQGVDPGRGDDARLTHRPADLMLVEARLLDEFGAPGQHRADRAPQPLG